MKTPQEVLQEYIDGIDAVNYKHLKSSHYIKKIENHRLLFVLAIRAIDLLMESRIFIASKGRYKKRK